MATYTVTDDALVSPEAEAYFQRCDKRVLIGLRAALELLNIPVPEYGWRKPPGRKPSEKIMAAYHADNGKPRSYELPARRPNATPEHVAAVKAARA